jgi:hypothetical protein
MLNADNLPATVIFSIIGLMMQVHQRGMLVL